MKWAYYIKYKLRAVTILLLILVSLLVGNILDKRGYSTLDESVASMYKDRLEVSHYLYLISNAMYRKKLLLSDSAVPVNEKRIEIALLNSGISDHISSYETTVLTVAEKGKWDLFKKSLNHYNQVEEDVLLNTSNNMTIATTHFNATLNHLDALSGIQVDEGKNIWNGIHHIVDNRLAFSSFEITMLIILGAFSLAVLSVADTRVFQTWQKSAEN